MAWNFGDGIFRRIMVIFVFSGPFQLHPHFMGISSTFQCFKEMNRYMEGANQMLPLSYSA
jgi:hypothetical protein